MAKTAGNFSKTDNSAQLREFLLSNLPKVIKYFQESVRFQTPGGVQESWAEIKARYDSVNRELERVAQAYDAFVFTANLDINPVRGDDAETQTYKERYNNLLEQKKTLRVKLLKQLLQQKLNVEEAEEATDWSTNSRYSWVTTYESDDDDEETKKSNEQVLRQRKKDLDDLCKYVLKDEEIRAYVAVCVVEKNKMQTQKASAQYTY